MKQDKRFFDRIVDVLLLDFFTMKSEFERDLDSSFGFLNSIKEPENDIDRSLAQYKCQSFLRKKTGLFVLNLGCFFLIIPFIIICLFRKINCNEVKEAVFAISIKDKSIIPSSLRKEFSSKRITNEHEGYLLSITDLKFVGEAIRHYFIHPQLLFRVLFKLSIYSYFISKYHPKAIVTNEEFSCTSSFLTYYCEKRGIEHINVMHGEKLLNIRDSFFRFHRCYVWDEYYIELFTKLRANKNTFVVEIPESLLLCVDKEPVIDYKYYLEDNQQLKGIAEAMYTIKTNGYNIKFRPHPTYTDVSMAMHYIDAKEIEGKEVPIKESIIETKHVISFCSTVLLQAYLSGIDIIIDDLNFSEEYKKLKELGYILITKNHKRLSDVISYLPSNRS